jgi:hypothetical protein
LYHRDDARLIALRDGRPKRAYVTVGVDDVLLEESLVLVQRMKGAGMTPTYRTFEP